MLISLISRFLGSLVLNNRMTDIDHHICFDIGVMYNSLFYEHFRNMRVLTVSFFPLDLRMNDFDTLYPWIVIKKAARAYSNVYSHPAVFLRCFVILSDVWMNKQGLVKDRIILLCLLMFSVYFKPNERNIEKTLPSDHELAKETLLL